MPQAPFQVDALQVEPGFTGTRTVDCDQSTGALRFVDPLVSGGIGLSALAGFELTGIYLVAKGGAGATYAAIQDAIDDVPTSSSPSSPSLILVAPGSYSERLTIEKDGIIIAAFGGGRIVIHAPDALGPTILVQENVATTPTFCRLVGLTVETTYLNQACVQITGGAGSSVGEVEISLLDCDLVADAVGANPISVDTVNNIRVRGGSWGLSSPSSYAYVSQTHDLLIDNVVTVTDLQLNYDGGVPGPSLFGSSYEIRGCVTGDVTADLLTQGQLKIVNCSVVGNVVALGDRILEAINCGVGDVTLNGTVAASLTRCTRGAALGTGTLAESVLRGSVSFVGTSSEAITFDVSQPDADYSVCLEYEVNALAVRHSKTTSGFVVEFPSGVQTTTVEYTVIRS